MTFENTSKLSDKQSINVEFSKTDQRNGTFSNFGNRLSIYDDLALEKIDAWNDGN